MSTFILAAIGTATEPAAVAVQQNSDVLLLGLAATGATVLSTLITGVVAVLIAKLNRKADLAAAQTAAVAVQATRAAVKVEEVRTNLKNSDNKIEAMARVVDDTHTLVNSNMEKQLLIASLALRRVADLTGHPDDKAAATLAETSLHEHRKKQRLVDQGIKIASDSSIVEHDHKEAVKETLADVKEVKQDVKDLKKGKP